MTATNHMMAGAVVATGVHQPLLVVPLAVLSHFLLDMLPHFGIHEDDVKRRNDHPLFRYILVVDVALTLVLLAVLPFFLKQIVNGWVVAGGMLLAWIPDSVWIHRFVRERRGTILPQSLITRFHQRIQWFERPVGIVVELLWFGAMGALLSVFAARSL
jgi:hypothetical protein